MACRMSLALSLGIVPAEPRLLRMPKLNSGNPPLVGICGTPGMPYCSGIPVTLASNLPAFIRHPAVPHARFQHQLGREDMGFTPGDILRLAVPCSGARRRAVRNPGKRTGLELIVVDKAIADKG